MTLRPLVCWCCGLMVAMLASCASPEPPLPIARRGVLDLRAVDFSRQPTVPLDGTWRWTWQALLDPAAPPGGPVEFTDFPRTWKQSRWRGAPIPSQGCATYELTVLLPPRPPDLGLRVPDVYTSLRVFVNGREVARSGTPGCRAAETDAHWAWHVGEVKNPADTLRILVQIANFAHAKGGPNRSFVLGDRTYLYRQQSTGRVLDFFLMGCLFMGGMSFLGLYLFGRHDQAILYFGLFCLCYSYRIVGVEERFLNAQLPWLSWPVTTRLEYVTLFLSVALFVRYSHALYPRDTHRFFRVITETVCYGCAALTLVTRPIFFTRLIDPFLGFMFVCILYGLYLYGVAARRNRPGAWFSLASTGLLMALFWYLNSAYFQTAGLNRIVTFGGYLGFFLLQTLVLQYRFAHRLQQARLEAEQGLRAKADFLSTMSHEIRTPLNAIIGMSHLLLADRPRPEQKEQLDVMLFSANNLLNIVNDILDFTKIEAGKISIEAIPMDLGLIARNVVMGYRSVADEKGLNLHLRLDDALPAPVLGDPTRTAQVLINLLHNAIKFTQEGSVEVSLTVGARSAQDVRVRLAVKDTGIGIPESKQKQIFDRFTQADASTSRSFGGTGLGLAICKRILEIQDVKLQVHSEVGRGSTFFFVQAFPLAPVPAEVPPAAGPRPPGTRARAGQAAGGSQHSARRRRPHERPGGAGAAPALGGRC
jgi:signal transduction histidine kinase